LYILSTSCPENEIKLWNHKTVTLNPGKEVIWIIGGIKEVNIEVQIDNEQKEEKIGNLPSLFLELI